MNHVLDAEPNTVSNPSHTARRLPTKRVSAVVCHGYHTWRQVCIATCVKSPPMTRIPQWSVTLGKAMLRMGMTEMTNRSKAMRNPKLFTSTRYLHKPRMVRRYSWIIPNSRRVVRMLGENHHLPRRRPQRVDRLVCQRALSTNLLRELVSLACMRIVYDNFYLSLDRSIQRAEFQSGDHHCP